MKYGKYYYLKLVTFLISMLLTTFTFGQININVDNAPYNATGDGVTDDRAAIQAALNDLRDNGGILTFTSGKTYIIGNGNGNCGLALYNYSSTRNYLITSTSNEKAIIKVADSTPISYGNWMFRLSNSRNIEISKLRFDGNRQTRNPESFGENPVGDNYLIQVEKKCDGLRLDDLIIENGVVDNLYIVPDESNRNTFMTDFEMHNCILNYAYRNNMAVIRGENFKIIGCEFNNALGAEPESGIDFEPNPIGESFGYGNMLVEGCSFNNNRRFAILLTDRVANCGNSNIKNNYFHNNGIHVSSDNNEINNNIFRRMDHAPILGANEEVRDGIIYMAPTSDMLGNNIQNNFFYDNDMPTDKHLIYLMYNTGGPNTIANNYEYDNTVASFILNSSKYSQNISNNVALNRRETGYWSMDASTISGSTINDLSYFNSDGILNGSPTVVPGVKNEALDFSPDNKYIEITSDDALDIEMNITISAWIKWKGQTSESQQIIFSRGSNWRFGIHGGNSLGFYATGSSSYPYTAGWTNASESIPTNEWVYVAMTYDGRYTKIYINGELKGIEKANGELNTVNQKLYIGSYSGNTYSFNGIIDGMKVYNYALSDSDIAYIYTTYPTNTTVSLDLQVSTASDDAEEGANGSVYLNSSDLELAFDSFDNRGSQTIGLRFTSLNVPQNAVITNAYIQFVTDETSSGSANLTIMGNDVGNSATLIASPNNISGRTMTSASVNWIPPAWNTVGETSSAQRTSNIASIVQEIIDRADWSANNSMLFIITGSGTRTAESYNSGANLASKLHVEYYVPLAKETAKKYQNNIPENYSLMQNYPNPFNPSTIISLAIPLSGNTNLSIYNILGEKVATLVNKELSVGSYEYQFDASNLSSGIYFYRLQSKKFTSIKKMMLVK